LFFLLPNLKTGVPKCRQGIEMPDIKSDLTRTVLATICIAGLICASLWVLRPFIGATIWATMLVVATWPLLKAVETRVGGRRAVAVAIMTVGLLLLLIIPLWLAIDTLVENIDRVTEWANVIATSGLPQPPAVIGTLPFVGEKLFAFWAELASGGPEGLAAKAVPYAAGFARWAVREAGSIGFTFLQLLLVVALAAIMYSNGEAAALQVRRFGRRLAGAHGESSVILAGQAIRGVALGVGVTAIVQTVLGGIGLAIAGVPFATLLAAVMLMLCIAQIGPGLILLPATGWMFWTGDTGWATFLLIWSLLVTGLDNFLRPALIRKGADLPLLLIFAGVIGGMLGFGLIGLFIGPVVLAVTYTLLEAWIEDALGKSA
jgi:predicted PurR-regulated permease PerM